MQNNALNHSHLYFLELFSAPRKTQEYSMDWVNDFLQQNRMQKRLTDAAKMYQSGMDDNRLNERPKFLRSLIKKSFTNFPIDHDQIQQGLGKIFHNRSSHPCFWDNPSIYHV